MRVLSLFDGISCGRLALDRAGIEYDVYLASEIDDAAIAVASNWYPSTVQLGNVRSVSLQDADLVLAGSPCQGFSIAGKRRNFDDPRSGLFFEFLKILDRTQPKYFLLENVPMKQEYQDTISGYLGVAPVVINSADFSAQDRKRLYWTNISIEPVGLNTLTVRDILLDSVDEWYEVVPRRQVVIHKLGLGRKFGYIGTDSHSSRIYNIDYKSPTLMGLGGGLGAKTGLYAVGNVIRRLTPVECERLQTVPDNYTNIGHTSDNKRYQMLGNGWTVDVIAHILKGIKNAS